MFDLEKLKDNNAIFWTFMFPKMRETAANLGWALGIHGSVVHDLDVMAMPWTEDHADADTLAKNLAGVCNHWEECQYTKHEGEKPCGRIVYTIPAGASYIDLSVMPLANEEDN